MDEWFISTMSCVPRFGGSPGVIILKYFFSVLDAGVETQEINETQANETERVYEIGADDTQDQVEESSEGCCVSSVSSSSTSDYSAIEAPSDGESCSQTAVVDENEAVQLGLI